MIRGIWDRETVALFLLAAALPIAMTWLWAGGWPALVRLVLALIASGAWHLVFMLARAQPPSFAGAVSALAVAMLAPEDLGLGALLLGISFGTVFGELVFGGWGRNLLNPATVTLAFLGFGFPSAPWPVLELQIGWAAIATAALGVLFGVMFLRLFAGTALAAAAAMAIGIDLAPVLIPAGVVMVLLVADPVASATTALGRWLNGLLYGLLVALFVAYWAGADPIQLSISSALLASLAAPLLDEIAITLWLAARRKRLG